MSTWQALAAQKPQEYFTKLQIQSLKSTPYHGTHSTSLGLRLHLVSTLHGCLCLDLEIKPLPGTYVAVTSLTLRMWAVRRPLTSANSCYPHVHPHVRRVAADWALLHLGRAIAASALVAAWYGGVRLRVDKADDARRLTTDG